MKMIDLESPFTGGLVEEVVETRAYEVRGQKVTVNATMCRCVDTNELFTTGEQDEAILAEMHRVWRERNQVPEAATITKRRVQLGLSAREASKLLGFGINQFSQYEAGELPSESNTLLLRFFCDPHMLRRLFDERMAVLQAKTVRKLEAACKAVAQRPLHRSFPTMPLVGSNWSGPGLYMAASEHELESSERAASFYVPSPRAGTSRKLAEIQSLA